MAAAVLWKLNQQSANTSLPYELKELMFRYAHISLKSLMTHMPHCEAGHQEGECDCESEGDDASEEGNDASEEGDEEDEDHEEIHDEAAAGNVSQEVDERQHAEVDNEAHEDHESDEDHESEDELYFREVVDSEEEELDDGEP
jgi:hypothetical protein